MALLNEQIAALRSQLGALQAVLDSSAAKDAEAKVQIEALGSQLNAALAQVAQEQKKRAEMEAAERARLQAENADLAKFRSEFFGQLSQLLDGREGVRVVGDRFVFSRWRRRNGRGCRPRMPIWPSSALNSSASFRSFWMGAKGCGWSGTALCSRPRCCSIPVPPIWLPRGRRRLRGWSRF